MRFLTGLLVGAFLRPLIRALVVVIVLAAGALLFVHDRHNLTSSGASARFHVQRAVDGDTLAIRTDGCTTRVRLLGIDTPETVKPGTPIQRCGPEASTAA